MIGHNNPPPDTPTLASAVEANLETAVYMLCRESLITAISDQRLDRLHLRLLAALLEDMNMGTAKVWANRQRLAERLKRPAQVISNKLRDLRALGYLIGGRERVPEADNRSLMVYTLGNVDHETIRREVTAFVRRVREERDRQESLNTVTLNARKSLNTVTLRGSKVTVSGDSQPKVTEYGDFERAKVTEYGDSCSTKVTGYGDSQRNELRTCTSNTDPLIIEDILTSNNYCSTSLTHKQAKRAPAKRATRLPDDWFLPRTWGEWALQNFTVSAEQVRLEAERFKNYWLAKGGAQGAKLDWYRTWQNWVGSDIRGWRRRPNAGVPAHAPDLAQERVLTVDDLYRRG